MNYSGLQTSQNGCVPKFVLYKNRPYRVLFLGPTRIGRRARLQFLDGTSEFWVDAGKTKPARISEEQIGYCVDCGRFSPQLNPNKCCPICAK